MLFKFKRLDFVTPFLISNSISSPRKCKKIEDASYGYTYGYIRI